MENVKHLLQRVSKQVEQLAKGNAVVAKAVSVGDRHIVPLCELKLGFGAGGGAGDEPSEKFQGSAGSGVGGGVGGGAKASPVAVLVIEDGKARLEKVGN